MFPNAKINLGLNITSKRSDGYHNLETIFYPIPLEDALEVHEAKNSNDKYKLYQSGNTIEGNVETNLVIKAYKLLDSIYSLPPLEIYLHKYIPSGAGLGGGSADAAFMLKLLNKKFSLEITTNKLEEYAASLGADCAFFIENKPTYAEGIGNIFSPISISLKDYQLYLIKPNVFVSTKDAFAYIKPQTPMHDLRETATLPIETWKELMVNDFEISVFKQHPILTDIKNELYNQGAIYAAMSGSGSSIFGIFDKVAELPTLDINSAFVFTSKL